MHRHPLLALVSGLVLLSIFPFSATAQEGHSSTSGWQRAKGFDTYTQIPGASRVGADVCVTCHPDVSRNFGHAFHAQQRITCEDCHGNGSLHVEGGGDVAKIVSFSKRPVQAANGVCLGCHARDERVRHWLSGSHAANHVRCADCHQIHEGALTTASQSRISFDTATRGASAASSVSPETNVVLRTRAATNDACLTCHQTQRAQLGLPYHHPLGEGKMSCVDCHDPHGGPTGNNLRTANVNQLCLSCHAQYRGPFTYQHPPVTENCMLCHAAHGSPNTNLLAVSVPALCLQCHSGHHNGAGLPLPDRCTNCHGSIHGTDVATPSGGSRFVDKGPWGVPSQPAQPASTGSAASLVPSHATGSPSMLRPVPSHVPTYAVGVASGALGMVSSGYMAPLSTGNVWDGNRNPAATEEGAAYSVSITPGSYRFIDGSGFLGRIGEYDSLQESAGADASGAYVSRQNHVTVVFRANVLNADDYSAAAQLVAGDRLEVGLDLRRLVQQQDNYPFYAGVMSPDLLPITDLVPSHTTFGVTRKLGQAYARLKLPKVPVRVFVRGGWQARGGETQLAYLDENATTTCGESCHYTSRLQQVNYTTRNIGGGADVDLGPVRVTWEHIFSSFSDRIEFPIGTYSGPFTPGDEPPPPPVPVPPDVAAGNYYLDIPSPNQSSSDHVNVSWTASPKLALNANVGYTRLRNTFTDHPQNQFEADGTLSWHPLDRGRLTADYHQHNLTNNFTPFYDLFGNVSYHNHWEGLRFDYQLSGGFDAEARYRHSGITRSNASLWPQAYSFDNTDLLYVVPASVSNTVGLVLRYHDRGDWSVHGGYEWTGTDQPGYLIVPESNHRVFADVTLTPVHWLVFANDATVIVQNAFPAVPLPNLPGVFQRENRFYLETASAAFQFVPGWHLGLGYSYQRNNLTTYMSFQNDAGAGYVVNDPAVPYTQTNQAFWGESTCTFKHRLGFNLRVTHNSARSGMLPDVNPNDAAQLGNQSLIEQGAFDPDGLFPAALGNLQFAATQGSQVIVSRWIAQSKVYYHFARGFEAGLIFDYGSYGDYWNPNLNGVLRLFNVYVGRSW